MTAIADLPDIRPSLLLDFANSGRVDPRIQCTRASSATCFGPDGKLRTVPANVPRIDYDPVTGKCLGLLVEEARTNLLTRSESLSHSVWAKTSSGAASAPTAVETSEPNPFGGLGATRLTLNAVGTTSNDIAGVQHSITVTAAQYTASFYCKAASEADIGKDILVRHASATGYQRVTLTNAWVRHSLLETGFGAGNTVFAIRRVGSSTPGDIPVSFFVWGLQLEQGGFGTSYIPTEGTAVTRATDKVSVPYTTAGAGALFVHGRYDAAASSTFFPVRARSEGNGYIGTPYCLTSGAIARSSYVRNNGGSPSNAVASGMNISTGLYKSVISWNGKNFASSSNGTISNSMTHELEFPICTHIDLCTASSSGPVLGASHIFQIAGYGAQLSPQNMQRLTA